MFGVDARRKPTRAHQANRRLLFAQSPWLRGPHFANPSGVVGSLAGLGPLVRVFCRELAFGWYLKGSQKRDHPFWRSASSGQGQSASAPTVQRASESVPACWTRSSAGRKPSAPRLLLWMVSKSFSHHRRKKRSIKFVGICRKIIIERTPEFLRRCEMGFVHAQYCTCSKGTPTPPLGR